ncbi:MAG: hypothetical protein WBO55_00500 [Rhizobiaceae bacterium]
MCTKCFLAMAGAAILTCVPMKADAGEVPSFLAGGQVYATTPEACKGLDAGGDESGGLKLKADGISGYEFGCQFVDFIPVRYVDVPEVTRYIAIASCGDDSGITRPDMIDLSIFDDAVTATSQNDYNYAMSRLDASSDNDPFEAGIINEQFALCR